MHAEAFEKKTIIYLQFPLGINELRKYKISIAAIQETRWNKLTPQAFRAMVMTSIPAALPIIINLEQLF
jgi:hypothetical protein